MGEERGVRSGRRSVDREQGSRDGGVGSAPAIQKLCAVGDLLREGMPEGVLTRRLGGTEKLGCRKALERRGELGRGQIDHGAQQLDWHVSPDHGRGLEHRSEEHTSELQSRLHLVCRLLLEKKKKNT